MDVPQYENIEAMHLKLQIILLNLGQLNMNIDRFNKAK